MRRLLITALLATTAATAAATACAAEETLSADSRESLGLTVYQSGVGLVHDRRSVALQQGENRLVVLGVSDQIQPETLMLTGAAGLRLREQRYLPADLTPDALLRRAVGETVLVARTDPQTGEDSFEEATLLSMLGGPVVRIGDRIELYPPGRIALKSLPADLRAEPALVVVLEAPSASTADLTLAYLTSGLSWNADYVGSLSEDGDRLALTGFVTLQNQTDGAFEHAHLRLLAGDVAQAKGAPPPPPPMPMFARAAAADAESAPVQQAASDRYLYTYDRPVDLAAGERKQITLLPERTLPAERHYRIEGLAIADGPGELGPVSADIVVEARNEGDGARPLPAGTVRVYEPVAGADTIFAGAGSIGHTPVGGEVKLALGSAFDVTASMKQTAYDRLSERSYETARRITVKNAKSEPVAVEVVGRMPGGWQLLSESQGHTSESASQPVWTLQVPAKGEAELTYKVRVTW